MLKLLIKKKYVHYYVLLYLFLGVNLCVLSLYLLLSIIPSLLDRCGQTTLHIRIIKTIANEVFKSIHHLNPTYMKKMFNTKEISYDLRDTYIMHPQRFNKIIYGKNTFKYHVSHIWNSFPENIKTCTSIDAFKSVLCQCKMCTVLCLICK